MESEPPMFTVCFLFEHPWCSTTLNLWIYLDFHLHFFWAREILKNSDGAVRYYETLHMPDDEPVAEVPVDWAFDKLLGEESRGVFLWWVAWVHVLQAGGVASRFVFFLRFSIRLAVTRGVSWRGRSRVSDSRNLLGVHSFESFEKLHLLYCCSKKMKFYAWISWISCRGEMTHERNPPTSTAQIYTHQEIAAELHLRRVWWPRCGELPGTKVAQDQQIWSSPLYLFKIKIKWKIN